MKNKNQKASQTANSQLLLTTDDHTLLLSYLKGEKVRTAFDRANAEELRDEIKKAKLVTKDEFPLDVVRINSVIHVQMEGKTDIMEFTLVTPDKADIKEKKISVLAPMGTALLGFKKGQQVQWQVPAGRKTFTILDVKNP